MSHIHVIDKYACGCEVERTVYGYHSSTAAALEAFARYAERVECRDCGDSREGQESLARGEVVECADCGETHPPDEACLHCDRSARYHELLRDKYTPNEAFVEAVLGGG